jgi:hypothetical protein
MVQTFPSLFGRQEQRRQRGGAMADGKGAWVHPTVPYSLMLSFLCNLDGTRDPFYSLAAARLIHRGPTALVRLGWALTAKRSSPGGSLIPRACSEASLSFPLAPHPINCTSWWRKSWIWWRLGFDGCWDLQLKICSMGCAIYRVYGWDRRRQRS